MTTDLLVLVAARFKVLADPTRLQLMNLLREGEMTVGELVEATGLGQANVSKHLQVLHAAGFASRRKDGLHVHYALADRSVFRLCDIMCGQIEAQSTARRKLLGR